MAHSPRRHRLSRRCRPALLQRALPLAKDAVEVGSRADRGKCFAKGERGSRSHLAVPAATASIQRLQERHALEPSALCRLGQSSASGATPPRIGHRTRPARAIRPGRTIASEQGFRACLGIARLVKAFGAARWKRPRRGRFDIGARTYGSVKSILDNNLDRHAATQRAADGVTVLHRNIRGSRYYQISEEGDTAHPPHSRSAQPAGAVSAWPRAFGESRDLCRHGGAPPIGMAGSLLDREIDLPGTTRNSAGPGCAMPGFASRCSSRMSITARNTWPSIDRPLFQKLVAGDWIDAHDNLIVCGPHGVGNRVGLLARLATRLPRQRSVLYQRVPKLFGELALRPRRWPICPHQPRAGRRPTPHSRRLGARPLDAQARHDLLEILEDRYGRRSTIIHSQLPVEDWHAVIGDQPMPTPSSTARPQRTPPQPVRRQSPADTLRAGRESLTKRNRSVPRITVSEAPPWATSSRNPGASIGMPGRLRRNPHSTPLAWR